MFQDITGQKFGRLTIIEYLGTKGHDKYWLCLCECGKVIETSQYRLLSGKTKSCGCLRLELLKKNHIKHGKCGTRLYTVFTSMKQRCYNSKDKHYKYYGGRGVTVCDEWRNDFQAFYDWSITNGYKDNLTIDRIDVDGNYEPNNCRWVTTEQQARNRRFCKYYTINGVTKCLSEWCRIFELNYGTVHSRIYRSGWSIEKALELEEK